MAKVKLDLALTFAFYLFTFALQLACAAHRLGFDLKLKFLQMLNK